jgi:hypothetical protein
MRRCAPWCFLFLLACGPAFSQANQIIIESTKASALKGAVYEGGMMVGQTSYRPDQAIQGVTVELCDSKFQNCTRQDTTDASGNFDIRSVKDPHGVYYLKFLLLGWCEHRLTVTVNKKAGPIVVGLAIGT